MTVVESGENGGWGHSPGFLIRRLHHIHLALFAEQCAEFDVTPVQYSVLLVVGAQPGRDQSKVAEEVGVDRATMTSVVARLERAGVIRRTVGREDRRQKLLALTARGRRLLGQLEGPAARAHERTLEVLSEDERAQFLSLLERLVHGGNGYARAKLRLRKPPKED